MTKISVNSKTLHMKILKPMLSLTVTCSVMLSATALSALKSQPAARPTTCGLYVPTALIRNHIPRSRLLYAHENIDEEDVTEKRPKIQFSLWSNMFLPKQRTEGGDKQQSVDEYLEFLDHRYHRLHDDEASVAPPSKRFSAWDWLSDSKEPCDPQRATDDALYVLGVSELASKSLLQKKRHTGRKLERYAGTIITTTATTVPNDIGGLFGKSKAKKSCVDSVKLRLQAQRRASMNLKTQRRKQSKGGNAFLQLPIKVAISAKSILSRGGGKKMTALTLSMLTALFLYFRSIISAVGVALGFAFHEA